MGFPLGRGRLLTAIAAAGLLVLAGVAAVVGTTGGTAGAITDAQAIAAVQAFDPSATSLTATAVLSEANGPYYEVDGIGVAANVDARYGTVRTLTLTNRVPFKTTTTVALSASAAQTAAVSFTTAHKIDTAGLTPQERTISTGSASAYEVDFTGRLNGALIPKHVSISIDPATGAVFSFVNFSHPYTAPPSPSLDSAAALSVARKVVDDPGATLDNADLLISFDQAGNQVLVWHVALTNVAPSGTAALVEVDALTGAAVILGRG